MASVLSGGSVSAAYSYTPWGGASGAGELPFFGYNSEEHAGGGTGLQYLRARFYDAASAAFPTADSYLGDPSDPSTLNRYAYCGGNPVAFSDPSGNERFSSQKQRNSWLKNNSAASKKRQQDRKTLLARQKALPGVGTAKFKESVSKTPLYNVQASKLPATAPNASQKWRTELPGRASPVSQASSSKGSASSPGRWSWQTGKPSSLFPHVESYAQAQARQIRERFCSRSMKRMGDQVPEPVKKVVQAAHDLFSVTGLTPIGVFTDPVDALLYFAQGEDLLGAVALVGTVPGFGDAVQAGTRVARHGDDIAGAVADAARAVPDVVKGAGAAADSASAVERAVRAANKVEDFDPLQKADSGKLRNALKAFGDVEPEFPHAAHHIIPGGHSRAEKARNILKKYEININSAANGVFLPTKTGVSDAAYHPSLHTYDYIDSITTRLEAAANKKSDFSGSRREVLLELEKIKAELQLGTFGKEQPL